MTRAWLLVPLLLLACSTRHDRKIVENRPLPGPTLAAAVAWERGTHGSRDLRRSAAIYQQLCADGAGEPEACRRWMDALVFARGVARDRRQLLPLATRLCQAGQIYACFIRAAVGDERTLDEAMRERFEAAGDTCLAGDLGACETAMAWDTFPGDPMGDSHPVPRKACELGLLEGCAQVFRDVDIHCFDEHPADECAPAIVAALRAFGDDDSPAVWAYRALEKACRDGDLRACTVLTGGRTPVELLCAAHDFGACGDASCWGKARARVERRALARAAGLNRPFCRLLRHEPELDPGTPSCREVAARLAISQPAEAREEVEFVCEEQVWSTARRVCVLKGGDPECEEWRVGMLDALGKGWASVATMERLAACESMDPPSRAVAAGFLDRLYVDFGHLMDPEVGGRRGERLEDLLDETAARAAQARAQGCL